MWFLQTYDSCWVRNGKNLGCPLLFTVIEECTKQTAVKVVQHCDQEYLIELKGCWELQSEEQIWQWVEKYLQLSPCTCQMADNFSALLLKMRVVQVSSNIRMETDLSSHLPDTVNELDKERRALWVSMVLITMTHALQHRRQQYFQYTCSNALSTLEIYTCWKLNSGILVDQ